MVVWLLLAWIGFIGEDISLDELKEKEALAELLAREKRRKK